MFSHCTRARRPLTWLMKDLWSIWKCCRRNRLWWVSGDCFPPLQLPFHTRVKDIWCQQMQEAEAQLFSSVTHLKSLSTAIFLIARNLDNCSKEVSSVMARRIMGTGKEFVFIFVITIILQLLCLLAGSLESNCSIPNEWLPKSALCLHPGKYTVTVENDLLPCLPFLQ